MQKDDVSKKGGKMELENKWGGKKMKLKKMK